MQPWERVSQDLGVDDIVDRLTGLSGADFTSLMLEVTARRAMDVSPADVVRQRTRDRFVAPGSGDLSLIQRVEQMLVASLPADVDTIVVSPVAPTGLHSSVAGVAQNRVLSTIRRTDVAADPTAGLALEAAMRRRSGDRTSATRLATVQRVVRAQTFEGPLSFAHFSLLGLISAGRDEGSYTFERRELAAHAVMLGRCLLATDPDEIIVTVTDWTGGALDGVDRAIEEQLTAPTVVVRADPDRTRAKGYYVTGALEISVRYGRTTFSAGDGGFTTWTAAMLADQKERLMISGLGVDRIALSMP